MKDSKVYLYTDISGNQIHANSYEFGSPKTKGLYIQGGIHGGEVTYFVFVKLCDWLLKNETRLKKKVTLAPVINPAAWNQRVYYYTTGKFDLYKGKDWNRSYGSVNQNTLSEKMSQHILELAKQHDFVMDLHTARTSAPYLIFTDQSIATFIKKYGLINNYFIDFHNEKNSKYAGTLNHALMKLGVSCVTYECGSHDSRNDEHISEVFNSIVSYIEDNIMTAAIIKTDDYQRSIFTSVDTVFAETSGFVNYLVSPRMRVKKGDPLMQIYSSSNIKTRNIIKSPVDGMILELSKTHICWEGDELIRIVPINAFQKHD